MPRVIDTIYRFGMVRVVPELEAVITAPQVVSKYIVTYYVRNCCIALLGVLLSYASIHCSKLVMMYD